jgi:hypothetical protein
MIGAGGTTIMTDQTQTKKAEQQTEILELNRETVQDLTELETEAAQGGLLLAGDHVISSRQPEG